jgi:UDP-galactopyranose mutase|tara:strand:+ start:7555 stop:8721 length:1167 start_codon:yes stop_codon:yes gene_type:complete
MKQPDIIVVGAGFSGAVMAERLASQSDKRVLILEQREHIGGNCYDYKNADGILIHQYGPHLFHTNKQHVWEYLSQFTQWHSYEHEVLSSVESKLVPLPFNLNTLDALYPQEQANEISELLIGNFGEGAKVPILELKQSAEPFLRELGALVYDKFFVNYTVKQWGCKPEEISPEVTARVPVVISRDNRYFHDTYQAIPAQGYTALFERMLAHKNIQVELNCDAIKRIALDSASGNILFDGAVFHGKLVFTGMLDALFGYIHGDLPYRSLRFEYEQVNVPFYQPATTVNYPNHEAFTRITEFKHILPADSPNTVIVKEYPQQFDRFDDNCNIPYYPIFNDENTQAHSRYKSFAKNFRQLLVLGRLADYKYYNMDDAVNNALAFFDAHFGD